MASEPRILLTSVKGGLDSMRAELYSMADYSTTAGQIPIPFEGGCWA